MALETVQKIVDIAGSLSLFESQYDEHWYSAYI